MGNPSEPELADAKKAGRETRRKQLLMFGGVALFPLAIILYGQYQLHQARQSEQWPVVPGKIVRSFVKSSISEGETIYSADIKYAYTVQGVEHRSDVVVIGGHSYGANATVNRYPLGKEVSVSYDPEKPRRAVLEPGVFFYGAHEIGGMILFSILTVASLLSLFMRRVMQEEVNLLEKTLFVTCKTIGFPFTYCKDKLWVVAGLVGLAASLIVADIDPFLTIWCNFFVSFYGLLLGLILASKLVGWVKSMQTQ